MNRKELKELVKCIMKEVLGNLKEDHGDVHYWGQQPDSEYKGTKITTGYKRTTPKPLNKQ